LLICETNDVVEFVKARETKLDLLFESVGFISFSGRQDTAEGLEPSMTTRYYSRLRAAQGLLPLLNAAASPRVVSILAGGHEANMNEEDLDLRKPGNYSIISAAVHSATMLTLAYEYLARENPRISFVHAFPRFVATPLFTRGSTGVLRLLVWQAVVERRVREFDEALLSRVQEKAEERDKNKNMFLFEPGGEAMADMFKLACSCY
jgi:hypothetical protein